MEKNNQPLIMTAIIGGIVLIIALAFIFTRNDTSEPATNDQTNTTATDNGENEGEDDGNNSRQPTPNPAPPKSQARKDIENALQKPDLTFDEKYELLDAFCRKNSNQCIDWYERTAEDVYPDFDSFASQFTKRSTTYVVYETGDTTIQYGDWDAYKRVQAIQAELGGLSGEERQRRSEELYLANNGATAPILDSSTYYLFLNDGILQTSIGEFRLHDDESVYASVNVHNAGVIPIDIICVYSVSSQHAAVNPYQNYTAQPGDNEFSELFAVGLVAGPDILEDFDKYQLYVKCRPVPPQNA